MIQLVDKNDFDNYVYDHAQVHSNLQLGIADGSVTDAKLSNEPTAIKQRYITHLIKTAQYEDEKVLENVMRWKSGDKASVFGSLMVSDPTCLATVHVTGAYGEERVLIRDICAKGVAGGKLASPIVEAIDYGYAYHVKPRDDNFLTGRFLSMDGYPIPIFESSHDCGSLNQSALSKIFAWNGVHYLATESHGINLQRMNGWLHGTYGQATNDVTVETVEGKRLITVQEKTSGIWYVIGCTPENQMTIQSTGVVAVEGAVASKTIPIVNGACYYGFGYEPMPVNGEMLICFAMGTEKDSTQQKVANALNDGWKTPFEQCKSYWKDFFTGIREKWLRVPPELRVKGYLAIMQLAISAYAPTPQGAFLGAGAGTWHGNFIRDTSWVIKSLAQSKPELSKSFIDWFSNVAQPLYTSNSYGIDGVNAGANNNTDNAPTFLLAIGEYYKYINDLSTMQTAKTQIDSAMQYAKVNYNAADGHILALHPHDFADDSYDQLPPQDIKYESMIDILWIAGLEAVRPVYLALGDTTNAEYCDIVSKNLRNNLNDYIVAGSNGRLCHSLKPTGVQQDNAWWFPSYLYDAWLLGNESSWKWCSDSTYVLGVRNVPLRYGLSIANIPNSQIRTESWGPFLGVVAAVAAKHGDLLPASFLTKAFPGGAAPEFWYMSLATDNKPAHYSHATNFPWGFASTLELINVIK